MDVLKGILAALMFSSLTTAASPPVDLTNPDEDPTLKKDRPLTEDDLVYTDMSDKTPTFTGSWGHVLIDTYGRNLPQREGKILASLPRGERVEVLKSSKDKKWYAVLSLRAHRKVWVPKMHLKVLTSYRPATPKSTPAVTPAPATSTPQAKPTAPAKP